MPSLHKSKFIGELLSVLAERKLTSEEREKIRIIANKYVSRRGKKKGKK